MAPQVDSRTLLYALGVLFAVGALIVFAGDVVFGLSVTVTAALLLLSFVAFFILGVVVDRERLDTVAFAISGLSYLVWLFYVFDSYDIGDTGVFLALAVSAVLFVALGYGLQTDRLAVDRRTAGIGLLAVAGLGVILVGADTVNEIEYSIELDDEATLTELREIPEENVSRSEAQLGTLTVQNPSLFTHSVDPPSVSGCVVGIAPIAPHSGDRSANIRYEQRTHSVQNQLRRGEELTVGIQASMVLPAGELQEGDTLAIERADSCDVTRSEPTIIVTIDDS